VTEDSRTKGEQMEELNRKLAEWLFPPPECRVEGVYDRFIAIDRQFTQEAEDYILSQDPSLKCSMKVGEWYRWENIPILTNSLDACFKWLVPKLHAYVLQSFSTGHHLHHASVALPYTNIQDIQTFQANVERTENPALALCKAIEKLIDEEAIHSG